MQHPDYEQLANNGMPAESLAQTFLRAYFVDKTVSFPLNPFQMLADLNVSFAFRPFKKYEGMYIPAEDTSDIPVVGVNSQRPITRQRYTAAHELCHHLKDSGLPTIACTSYAQSEIERYAENFAAELLMPSKELRKQVEKYEVNRYVEFADVVKIAEYFGVSFQACLNKIAWRLHKIKGDTSPKALVKRRNKFKPAVKRREFGFNDVVLYEQLFDAGSDYLSIELTPRVKQRFKAEYVFQDSRMEGVDIDIEKASEIVVDLRLLGSKSEYCRQENQNIIEVAGLSLAYDYVFDSISTLDFDLNVYEAKRINEKLFSTAPCPELGGNYRESNTLVLGAKFETVDYKLIPTEMYYLDKEIQSLLEMEESMSLSEYIEAVLRIHHRLTVIHAFRDGNGRTTRAFTNMFLIRKGMPPVLFRNSEKNPYKDALALADESGNYAELFEVYFKALIQSHVELSIQQ